MKRLCAESFGLSPDPDKLVLIHTGARVDPSAFPTLGHYLKSLSPQQRAKFSLGIAELVRHCLQMHVHVHVCYYVHVNVFLHSSAQLLEHLSSRLLYLECTCTCIIILKLYVSCPSICILRKVVTPLQKNLPKEVPSGRGRG